MAQIDQTDGGMSDFADASQHHERISLGKAVGQTEVERHEENTVIGPSEPVAISFLIDEEESAYLSSSTEHDVREEGLFHARLSPL